MRHTAKILKRICCRRDINKRCLLGGLAAVSSLNISEFFGVLTDELGNNSQILATFFKRKPRPSTVIKSRAGSKDRPVHITNGRISHARINLTRRGIDAVEHPIAGRRDQLTID